MAQLKKLLVAYDGSTQSKEALDWAIDLSLLSGAQVIAVKVSEPLEVVFSQARYSSGCMASRRRARSLIWWADSSPET